MKWDNHFERQSEHGIERCRGREKNGDEIRTENQSTNETIGCARRETHKHK